MKKSKEYAKYVITCKVGGKKRSAPATTAKERDALIRDMKSGRWRENYTDIKWKRNKS